MCFELDSRPPILPIAGASMESRSEILTAADGTAVPAFRAWPRPDNGPTTASGAGIVILPDVRGLHRFYEELALRFAERGIEALAIDWFGRTAPSPVRGEAFDHVPHVVQTTWAGISADIAAGVAAARGADGTHPVFTLGFCMGGRMSFLAATLGLDLAGVIGLYGTLAGPWRNDAPAPVDRTSEFESPVLGLFGGADTSITPEAIAAFDEGLTATGIEHRLVTYPGAPHSFFDRKAAEFADESAAAWDEILAFIERHAATR